MVEVAAGPHLRRDTPVVFALPAPLAAARAVTLTDLDQAKAGRGPAPRPSGRSRRAWSGCIRDPLPAGATRRYRLEPADPAAPARAAVTCVGDGKHLRLQIGDRPVLQYNTAMVESPGGIEPYYRRSGQIHPLFTPSGRIVSDDFPPDHAHQHAVFFAWVNTTFEGRHLDFWNQKEQTGRIEHAATLGMAGGPVFGQFQVKLRHDDMTAPGGPRPVLDEVWTVRAYNCERRLPRRFRVAADLCRRGAADDQQVSLWRHGTAGQPRLVRPDREGEQRPRPGPERAERLPDQRGQGPGDGQPYPAGLGRPLGPDRRRARAASRSSIIPRTSASPSRSGSIPTSPTSASRPMVPDSFEIAPGQPYVSHYRFVVHDGAPDVATLQRLWHDYSEPPGRGS